jgi:hypothetical protein
MRAIFLGAEGTDHHTEAQVKSTFVFCSNCDRKGFAILA